MVLNGKNGGFFLDLDSSDAQPVTLDLGPDKEPEETTPEEPSSPMTLTVSKADDSAPSSAGKIASDDKVVHDTADFSDQPFRIRPAPLFPRCEFEEHVSFIQASKSVQGAS